jgi:hypothetical protein
METKAGWYWQFNRKKGYKHDGTTLTPAWSIASINENSNWITVNDPCSIELGAPWRLPTYVEWLNVYNAGGWTDWNGPWNSALKLHAAGYLNALNGLMSLRGSYGYYWSSSQSNSSNGSRLYFVIDYSDVNVNVKARGFSVRCLR